MIISQLELVLGGGRRRVEGKDVVEREMFANIIPVICFALPSVEVSPLLVQHACGLCFLFNCVPEEWQ